MFQQDGSPNISIPNNEQTGQAVHVLCGLGNSEVGWQWALDGFKIFRGEISWRTKFALEKYDEKFWSQPISDGHQEIHRLVFFSRVVCPI